MSLKDIIREVAEERGLPVTLVLSRARNRVVAHARQEAMWRARQVTRPCGKPRYSYPQIGRAFDRKHETVIFGVRQHSQRIENPVQSCGQTPTQQANRDRLSE